MTFRTLIRRSLRFHWRAHLGVVLGAAVGSAALIGALVVGDSVRESLREKALERIGRTWAALAPQERTVTEQLGQRIESTFSSLSIYSTAHLKGGQIFPALALDGVASSPDGSARANQVHLIGVNPGLPGASGMRWWQRSWLQLVAPGGLVVNEALASQLRVQKGDEVLFRVPKLLSASREASLSPRADATFVLRLQVRDIVPAAALGNFRLTAHSPPLNAFVALPFLQQAAGLTGRVNVLLLETMEGDARLRPLRLPGGKKFDFKLRLGREAVENTPLANHSLRSSLQLDDADAQLGALRDSGTLELRTRRVFLDAPVARETLAADTNAQPLLSYLVNLLRAGTNTTPYSMVTAAGAPWTPADMRDDEILVSQWLAEDLQVKAGDEIALTYFDPESGARLTERTNTFRVRGVVPMEMPWADRTLMPDFPGIENAEKTSEWDAGFPLVHKIRQKDEDYWRQHRGTPKAFVTLAAGKEMWANRFGELTAIRFPILTNSVGTRSTASQTSPQNGDAVERVPTGTVEEYRAVLEEKILANLKPEELGLRFEPVREQALKAAEQSQDFGQLFLGFSFFLIIAALLLMVMLFQFGLEQRTAEIGTLLALGFTPKQVRRLLLGEGVALAFLGGVLGALGGMGYARAMLHGLTTIWREAVGQSALSFHATPQTLVIGLCASTAVNAVTIWLALRKFVRRPATQLLTGEVQSPESSVHSWGRAIGFVALASAFGLVVWALARGDTTNAGAFFGAGTLVLVAGVSFASAWLARLTGSSLTRALSPSDVENPPQAPGESDAAATSFTLGRLGVRGCARRRKRSLATVAMLACGSFLIVSIGVFRLDANRDATKRSSGTGGFALIGETTMPVVHDLNSRAGRDFFALNEHDLQGVSFVPFRVREGDEASCLNLNRAQKPRLLGVKPEVLEGRFTFAKRADGVLEKTPWATLQRGAFYPMYGQPLAKDEVAAIGDANSIQWAMHKKVGDTIDYVDERGQPFKVRIVGAVANSIVQGSLIIDEAEFVKRFPSESGYRMFLIDAPSNGVSQISATLSRAMQDVGLELTPAAQRLAQFNAVQNTYLGTFQVLGGLGLLLGSVGLGIVVLRNVLERRGELAVLLAVGFRARMLQKLVLIEHGALLALGLALGVTAAAVAVLPALLSPAAQLPYGSLAITLGAVLINGTLWTWVATRVALRGNLLEALRNE